MSDTTDIAALAAAMARARGRRQCRAAACPGEAGSGSDTASTSSSSSSSSGGSGRRPLVPDGTAAPPPPNPLAVGGIAAAVAAAARKRDGDKARKFAASPSSPPKRSSPLPLPPGGIGALAAEAARKREANARGKSQSAGSPPPGGIGSLAAEAARKRELGRPTGPQKRTGAAAPGLPGGIAIAAAEAARKNELKQQSTPTAPLPPGGIASAAAEAARKKGLKQQSTPPALLTGGIAAAAAEKARRRELKRQSTPPASLPVGILPVGTAALAADLARQKGQEQQSAPPALPPEGIAAAAAEAARKKELRRRSTTPALPPGAIAAAAAEAAREKESKKKPWPQALLPPGGIAAAAAAEAARKEEFKHPSSPSALQPSRGFPDAAAETARKRELKQQVAPALPPGGIAAAAREAARKKELKQQSATPALPPGGIAAAVAEAARKKKLRQQALLPPGGIASAAAEAARKKELKEKSAPPALPPGGIAAATADAAAEAARKKEPKQQPRPSALPPGGIAAAAAEAARKKALQRQSTPPAPGGIGSLAETARRREPHSQAETKLPDSSMTASASPDNPAAFFDCDGVDPSQFEELNLDLPLYEPRNAEEDEEEEVKKREARWHAEIEKAQAEKCQQQQQLQNQKQQQQQSEMTPPQDDTMPTRRKLEFDTPHQSTPGPTDTSVDDCDADEAAEDAGVTSMNFEPRLSSLRTSQSSDETPMLSGTQADVDALHARAAEALIRVIETRRLDLDIVLERLEEYRRRTSGDRRREGRFRSRTFVDTDNYDDDGRTVTSQWSSLSKPSANQRRIASNGRKLAAHVVQTAPSGLLASSQGSKTVPLKDDPEYSLYYRMLRYGFTMGAVRAALVRDGRVDITGLDPDRPVGRQRVPRVEVSAAGDGVAPGNSNGLTDEGWEAALADAAARMPSPTSSSGPLSPRGGGLLRKRNGGAPRNAFDTHLSNLSSTPPWLQSGAQRGTMQGWLRKRTRRGRWVRRWYLLDSTGIYYARSPPAASSPSDASGGSVSARKFTRLVDARSLGARMARDGNGNEFEVYDPSRPDRPAAALRAADGREAGAWVDAIRTAVERQRLVDGIVVGSAVSPPASAPTAGRGQGGSRGTPGGDRDRPGEDDAGVEPPAGYCGPPGQERGGPWDEGGVVVAITDAELRSYRRTSGGPTGVAASPDDFFGAGRRSATSGDPPSDNPGGPPEDKKGDAKDDGELKLKHDPTYQKVRGAVRLFLSGAVRLFIIVVLRRRITRLGPHLFCHERSTSR